MRPITLAVYAATVICVSGCGGEMVVPGHARSGADAVRDSPASYLAGTIGEVEVRHWVAPARVYRAANYVSLQTFVLNADTDGEGAAMSMLLLNGGFEAFPPGTDRAFEGAHPGPHMPYAAVVGCSGGQDHRWDYDVRAVGVRVVVSEHAKDPRLLDVQYIADLSSDGTDVFHGRLIVPEAQ